MAKQVLFSEEARDSITNGIDLVSNAVKVTIGPRGRNVVLEKSYGAPNITNDGVSIAKDIELSDKFENMGAEIVKEVASKTNDAAGDGTTTAMVLTQSIVTEGVKQVAMGVNAMGIRLGIEKAGEAVVEALREVSIPVKGKSEIKQIASISAESEDIGGKIAETIDKVGKDGVVTVEESQSFGIETEVVEGMELDKGYVSPYMVTDSERMEAEYKDAAILITDKKISSAQEVLPLLEKVAQSGRKEMVLIADDVEGEALTTFVVNKLRGSFNVLAVKAPGYGDRKKEMLQDIATVTGGSVVSEDTNMTLENAELSTLGKANKVVATKDKTQIVGGKGKKAKIEERIQKLKNQIENSDSKFDKEKLSERVAKLSGGVAVIQVGAATETEMKYLKAKTEDAVNATKAAIEEGIVHGGGSALIKAAQKAKGKDIKCPVKSFEREFEVGIELVLKSLEAPLKQIAANSGREEGAVVVEKVKNAKENEGYNAVSGELVDMIQNGIIDPVKVTRNCVQHATSAAAMLLTTEAAVADEPKKEGEDEGGGAAGMGGGMPGMM